MDRQFYSHERKKSVLRTAGAARGSISLAKLYRRAQDRASDEVGRQKNPGEEEGVAANLGCAFVARQSQTFGYALSSRLGAAQIATRNAALSYFANTP